MKKVFLFFLAACFSSLLVAEEKQDMVVLFDTSVSVLPIYDILSGYLVQGLVQEQLKPGDNFHLLSFAGNPEYEFSQSIMGKTEEDRIISYTSVLKPMGLHTDLISALNYLYRFTKDLSLNSHKIILILTDGIHDPPPGSALYGKNEDFVRSSLEDITRKIYREGWEVHIVETPVLLQEETDKISFSDLLSQELGVPAVKFEEGQTDFSNRVMGNQKLSVMENLGDIGYRFELPLSITNYAESSVVINIHEIQWKNRNILRKKIKLEVDPGKVRDLKAPLQLTPETEPGDYKMNLKFVFSEGTRVAPDTATVQISLIDQKNRFNSKMPLFLLIGAAVLLLVFLMVVFVRRRIVSPVLLTSSDKSAIRSSPLAGGTDESEVNESFKPKKDLSEYTLLTQSAASQKEKQTLKLKDGTQGLAAKKEKQVLNLKDKEAQADLVNKEFIDKPSKTVHITPDKVQFAIEMHVTGQNPFKGTRNINVINEGERKLIGGKSCPFTIFIIPIHDPIGEISFDGNTYRLNILKPEHFPDLKRGTEDCLNIYFSVKDTSGRRTQIVFRKWISPLEKINRIMHLTDKPGIPDFHY